MSSTGAATFTAANGDTLTATVVGQATRTSPTTLSIVEVYTITGRNGTLRRRNRQLHAEKHSRPADGR